MQSKVKAIQAELESATHVLVITHIDPDGDALGSLMAVGEALAQMGKKNTLMCDDKVPGRFHYLPLSRQVKQPQTHNDYDLLIVVDCGDKQRMGASYALLPEPLPPLINIDHHVTNTQFGDINLVDTEAVSTTEILFDLFSQLEITITANIAQCLLTGLVTDTLGFRTVGVSAKTLKIAGDLMEGGADLALITTQGLSLKPLSTLQLWQFGLTNMKFEDGLIWTTINNEQRQAIGYTSSSTGGLVNLMADVETAAMSAVLLEMGDGSIRVGFRCRPPFSVSELALNLGGGGHPLAAGCTLRDASLREAEMLVVALSKEAIRQQQALLTNGHG